FRLGSDIFDQSLPSLFFLRGPMTHIASILAACRGVLPSVAIFIAAAHAQTVTGTVEGRVTDPAGAVVPGVAIRAKEMSTGTMRETRTNSDGFYEFSYLASGDYELAVEAPQFERQTGKASVGLNRTVVVNFRL